MARTLLWAGLAALALVGALGLAHIFTEGALFSTAAHVWRIGIDAEGDEAWRVEVPTLQGGAHAGSLDALFAELHVAGGDATLERNATRILIDGRGDAMVQARHEFWGMRSASFGDWRASASDAARLDDDAPARVNVTWSLDLVASGGHTCGGNGSWSAQLGPRERAPLTMSTMTPQGRADEPLSTSPPPVMLWCN